MAPIQTYGSLYGDRRGTFPGNLPPSKDRTNGKAGSTGKQSEESKQQKDQAAK